MQNSQPFKAMKIDIDTSDNGHKNLSEKLKYIVLNRYTFGELDAGVALVSILSACYETCAHLCCLGSELQAGSKEDAVKALETHITEMGRLKERMVN